MKLRKKIKKLNITEKVDQNESRQHMIKLSKNYPGRQQEQRKARQHMFK